MEQSDQKKILEHFLEVSHNNSQASFRIIYNHYYNQLFRQALYYFEDPDISQEIVSDVFVALWQSRKILHRVEDPDAYLFISLKHARSKYIRQHYREKQELFTDSLPHTYDAGEGADSDVLDKEAEAKYQEALAKLPPRCAEVFRLVREEKKKYAEAAELLGISVKTVDNQMNKAVKILYSELKEHLFSAFF